MYSHPFFFEFMGAFIVVTAILYLAFRLITHRTVYTRFVGLAIGLLLLVAVIAAFTLGHSEQIYFFYKIQRTLLTLIILLSCFVFTRLCDIIVWNGLLVKNGRPIFPKVLIRFINFFIFLIALFIIIQWVYGFNITQLLVASSLVALVLAYGAQANLSNIFSGITLNIARNIDIGDWIEIEIAPGSLVAGHVDSLDWRCVTLKNYEENLVVIPNSILAEKVFVNYSQPYPLFKQQFYLKIAYTVRPDEAIFHLKKALSENDKICTDKETGVHLFALEGDSAVYHLEFFCKKYVNYDIRDEIIRSAYYQVLRTHHSAAPFVTFSRIPHPSDALRINREKIMELLSSQTILECLQADELSALINAADFERFSINEVLLQQGVANTCLYILLDGRLQIEQQNENEDPIVLATLDNFALLGEYSMLLGEMPRQTVRCVKESLVMIIRREVFHHMVQNRLEIINALEAIIESRALQNRNQISHHQEKKEKMQEKAGLSVLERLKNIFINNP